MDRAGVPNVSKLSVYGKQKITVIYKTVGCEALQQDK
jgi:hypothetical protein